MSATARALTPAIVKEYVEGGGTRCPYCHSEDIEAGPLEADGDSASGTVECLACGKQWREVFTLSAVETPSGFCFAGYAPKGSDDDPNNEPVLVRGPISTTASSHR
ncbi:MAG: hypothetical protein P4L84_32805 [Isosphaeraceae bacterium]|nr:hypothetical protein [Isosphaeraceae bacterium]